MNVRAELRDASGSRMFGKVHLATDKGARERRRCTEAFSSFRRIGQTSASVKSLRSPDFGSSSG